MTTTEDKTTWLRPEFKGPKGERQLITVAEIAEIADTDPKQVRWWVRTQESFPKPVKELPVGNGPKRWFVATEVIFWLLHHRPRQTKIAEAARLRITIASINAEVEQLEAAADRRRALRDDIQTVIDEQRHTLDVDN